MSATEYCADVNSAEQGSGDAFQRRAGASGAEDAPVAAGVERQVRGARARQPGDRAPPEQPIVAAVRRRRGRSLRRLPDQSPAAAGANDHSPARLHLWRPGSLLRKRHPAVYVTGVHVHVFAW